MKLCHRKEDSDKVPMWKIITTMLGYWVDKPYKQWMKVVLVVKSGLFLQPSKLLLDRLS